MRSVESNFNSDSEWMGSFFTRSQTHLDDEYDE